MKSTNKKFLTYEELINLAKKNYTNGGDGVVECWDKNTFSGYVQMYGGITKRIAMQIIRA